MQGVGGSKNWCPVEGKRACPGALGPSAAGPALCAPSLQSLQRRSPLATPAAAGVGFGSGRERGARQGPTQPPPPSSPSRKSWRLLPSRRGPPQACLCPRPFSRVKKPVSWSSGPQQPLLGRPLRTRLNGMPYFLRMMGEMRVILCRRKASQPWELPGKNPEAEKVGVRVRAGSGQRSPGSSFLRRSTEHRAQHQGSRTYDLVTQRRVLCGWREVVTLWPSLSTPGAENLPALRGRTPTAHARTHRWGRRGCAGTSPPAPPKTRWGAAAWPPSRVRAESGRQDAGAGAPGAVSCDRRGAVPPPHTHTSLQQGPARPAPTATGQVRSERRWGRSPSGDSRAAARARSRLRP